MENGSMTYFSFQNYLQQFGIVSAYHFWVYVLGLVSSRRELPFVPLCP